MSVQFIIGSSGSGKSTYLYHQVIEASIKAPQEKFFFIVPEQFTMSTQRAFVTMHPDHTIMNIDVLSFHRLAYRIFTELGLDYLSVLDDTGKNLILHRIASEHPEAFPVLGKKLKRPGYIDEMKSLISELTQYHISPEELLSMGDTPGMPPVFSSKTKEIAYMYEAFMDFIRGSHITSEQILETLAGVIEESELLKDATFVFDGFTGFTPLQNDVVERLMKISKKIMISVILDPSDTPYYSFEDHELFSMSKKFMSKMSCLAQNVSCDLDEPVIISLNEHSRFTKDSVFGYLENHIFRHGESVFDGDVSTKLRVYRLENPRSELEFCAGEIRRLSKEEGYRYSDMAIVCSDISTYKNYIPEIFPKYDIPVFTDASLELSYQPAVEFILSFLEIMDKNYSYESVIHCLRTGVFDFSAEEIDLFDSYLYRSGIRGLKRYCHIFTVRPKDFSEDEMLCINSIRDTFYSLLKDGTEVFQKNSTVAEKSQALREIFLQLSLKEKMEKKSEEFTLLEEEVRAQEYGHINEMILSLLEKLDFILGEEEVSAKEYSDLLRSGFSAAKIGIIPPLMDGVVFGDLERTRLEHIKVLFLVGAVDGLIPKVSNGAGILSQNERTLLKEADYELAPTERERSFMQKFYLYQVLTKASDRLFITYCRLDSDGAGLRKSYIVSELQGMFPKLLIHSLDKGKSSIKDFYIYEQCRDTFLFLCHELKKRGTLDGSQMHTFATLISYLQKERPQELEELLKGVFFQYKEDGISKAVSKALNGSDLYVSVSKLERYAQCAYQYFLQYGLRLRERREHAFESYDIGNIYHEALERFSRIVSEREGSWSKVSDEKISEYVKQAVSETYGAMEKTEVYDTAREVYILHRLEETLKRTVWAIMRQVKKGAYEPKRFEVSLGEISNLSTISYELNDDVRLHLDGKIDRVDTCEQDDCVFVKIIDYKSGNKDLDYLSLYYGLQIQLVFYMGAAIEGIQHEYPDKKVLPGAMLYYHIDNPFVEAGGDMEATERALLMSLRPKGRINDSNASVAAIDTEIFHPDVSESEVVNLKKKKNGDFSATTQLLSEEDFGVLSEFVRHKAIETGENIASGKIKVAPYKNGQHSGCDYCPYHGICGFETGLDGYEYKTFDPSLDSKNVLERIREDVTKREDRHA